MLIISTIFALLLLGLSLFYVFLLLGKYTVKKKLSALEIPEHHKSAALECFNYASKLDSIWLTIKYRVTAPIVLFFVLRKLPWEANNLPDKYKQWENDVSINGDSGGVLYEGKWINFYDVAEQVPGGWEAVKDCLQVSYSDPRYQGDAYYARGHHPRSFWARYIWLAFRNVRSKEYVDNGFLVLTKPEIIAEEGDVNTSSEGFRLYKSGDAYQWHSTYKFGPICLWSSVGYKLSIAYGEWKDVPKKVAVTGLWGSPKGWKE